ncbi:MAG: hypothetical protein ACTSUG_00235 [Candidatus Helarchaeota archaeon]
MGVEPCSMLIWQGILQKPDTRKDEDVGETGESLKTSFTSPHFIIMKTIERIIKGTSEITCDNENCEYRGDMWWCYFSKERQCGIYKEWEQKMIKYSGTNKNVNLKVNKFK